MEKTSSNKNPNSSVVIGVVVGVAIFVITFFVIAVSNFNMGSDQGSIVDQVTENIPTEHLALLDEVVDEEKEEIIQAMLRSDSIMRSGDAEAIREGLSVTFPEIAGEFSDQDLQQISEYYSQGIPEVTANILRGDDVEWSMGENRANASVVIDGQGGVYEAVKIDGVWY